MEVLLSTEQLPNDPLLLLDDGTPNEIVLLPFVGCKTDFELSAGDGGTPVLPVSLDGELDGIASRVEHGWKFDESNDAEEDLEDDSIAVPPYLLPDSLRDRVRTRGEWTGLTEADLGTHADYIQAEFGDLVEAMITLTGCGFHVTVDSREINKSEAEVSLRAARGTQVSDAATASKVFNAAAGCGAGDLSIRYVTTGRHWVLDLARTGVVQADGRVHPCDPGAMVRIALFLAPEWCFVERLDRSGRWHSDGDNTADSLVSIVAPPAGPAPVVGSQAVQQRKDAVALWAAQHLFSDPLPPSRDAIIKHLEARNEGFAGYYVLQFADGECYVGQSQNLPRRVGYDHPKRFKDIETIRVRPDVDAMTSPLPLRHLLATERRLIHSVQRVKAPARNMSDMTITSGTKDFLALVPLDDQRRWLASPEVSNLRDGSTPRRIDMGDFAGAKHAYERLRDEYAEYVDQVERIVGAYIARCIPFPFRTEYKYWSVSAVPGFRNKEWQRLACVTTSWTETLVVTMHKATGSVVGFLQVADVDLFGEDETVSSYLSVVRRHPGTFDNAARYVQSGPGNTVLHTVDLDGLERLLDDTAVTRAAATAALNIMNKRGVGKVKESHNPYLVDAALRQLITGTAMSAKRNTFDEPN